MSQTEKNPDKQSDKTHFGFEQVDVADKARRVGEVFHSVASKYDIMNDVMSLGIHRIWKHLTIAATGVKSGDVVLDLAGGTGDLTSKMSPKVGKLGQVVLADINASMLEAGRNRLLNEGKIDNITYAQVNAEALPFADQTFDVITMAFGLRNVTNKETALCSMHRVLKPGGRLFVLEFSTPTNDLFSKVYDAYSFHVLPKMGQLIAGDGDSYKYLAESIRMHPDQSTLQAMMYEAGFAKVAYENMTQGAVALHIATKAA